MTVLTDSFQCKFETFKIKVIKAKLHSLFKNNYIVLVEKEMATHSSVLAWRIPQRSLVGCSSWGLRESDMTE